MVRDPDRDVRLLSGAEIKAMTELSFSPAPRADVGVLGGARPPGFDEPRPAI
jgi:hypothetical protein